MKGFAASFAPQGRSPTLHSSLLHRLDRLGNAPRSSIVRDTFAAVTWSDGDATTPGIVEVEHIVCVGEARLTHAGVGSVARQSSGGMNDLSALAMGYAHEGAAIFPQLHGDFACVLFDERRQELYALRDSFGIRRLFWTKGDNIVRFSSLLEFLNADGRLDERFAWSHLTFRNFDARRSVWQGVNVVPAATHLRVARGCEAEQRYWIPGQTRVWTPPAENEQCELFASLVREAIHAALPPSGETWCEVSGGLDSATVFLTAASMCRSGAVKGEIGGTYTHLDDYPGADEGRFTRAILDRCEVRNEQRLNSYPWQDDREPPPRTDEPRAHYPFWARDRWSERVVRDAGGVAILSGAGSDQYLSGTYLAVADHLRAGRVRTALSEAHRLAVGVRASFWSVLWRYGLQPLFPALRSTSRTPALTIPAWIAPGFTRQVGRAAAEWHREFVRGKKGSESAKETGREFGLAAEMHELPLTVPVIEKRYPFYYRPLVDYALSLPPRMLLRNGVTKWALREAARGLLPDAVRLRRSKGWMDGRICNTFAKRRPFFLELLRDPLLAQAGIVERDALLLAFEAAANGVV